MKSANYVSHSAGGEKGGTQEGRRPARKGASTKMTLHSNYQTLINRGRKAGLNTRELYSAISVHPVEGREQLPGQADPNGFVSGVDAHGHRVSRPNRVDERS